MRRLRTEVCPPRRCHQRGSRAFTLVELLIVVAIIAVLVALIVPSVGGAMRNARDAKVRQEIASLEAAIAQFKAQFGVEPPSSITLCEQQSAWSVADMTYIKKIWQNFDFSTQDRNGSGTATDSITLTPAECLVFFLGGVQTATTPPGLLGFSTNPRYPFIAGGARVGPFFEFDASRLRTRTFQNFTVSSYVDPQPDQVSPYLYFSTYGGAGYRATERTVAQASVSGAGSFADFYRTSSTGPYHKSQSYQLISPGADGLFGIGGVFSPSLTNNGLTNSADHDNITNFHTGRLLK